MKKERIILLCAFLIYMLSSIGGMMHHEIWADEMHHFLLGRDSGSLNELCNNARYEGHPLLWNIILFVITRFTNDPVWMQIIHLIISFTTIIIFLRYAPFHWTVKVLFTFGYYMLFEYNLLCRNYALSALFLFWYVHENCKTDKKFLKQLLLLFLLANTHLFSFFISIALFFLLVSENRISEISKQNKILSLIFLVTLGCIFYFQILPPNDHMLVVQYNADPLLSFKRISKVLGLAIKGFLPIPDITQYHLWNNNLIINHAKYFAMIFSSILIFMPLILFYKNRRTLLLFYLPAFFIFCFVYISPLMVANRHAGFLMLLLLVCFWYNASSIYKAGKKYNMKKIFLYSLLIIQLLSGSIMFMADWTSSFSCGKETAEYLHEQKLDRGIIAMSNMGSGSPLSGYLGRKLFYAELNDFGSFAKWNTIPFIIPQDSVINRVKRLSVKTKSDIILVMNSNLIFTNKSDTNIDFIAVFNHSIIGSENYFVYRIHASN